jgi:coenzyme F420-0:L-glutamate ligase/coenzyme F420-1:gamma-L-glutamate ligase
LNHWDLTLRALPGLGLIRPGADLTTVIAEAARADAFTFADHDVIVVAQKIVSKAEGRTVNLQEVTASPRAQKLAERTGRDARLCQLYLNESRAIVNVKGRHVVTVDNRGFQGTGAGVDMSNAGPRSEGRAVLLPVDPDASARRIRCGLQAHTGRTLAVIVTDSFGSEVRDGAVGSAIGLAGIRHVEAPGGERDLYGNPSSPVMNRVDEIASAASILMGQTDAGKAVVVCRGAHYTVDEDASIGRLLIGPALPHTDFDLRPGF